jgi:hypothetical protein
MAVSDGGATLFQQLAHAQMLTGVYILVENGYYGENIILFLLKLISKKLSRKKGKINTIQHDQGEKHRQRIFSPSTPPSKAEQLIAWPRREKMKTQGEN